MGRKLKSHSSGFLCQKTPNLSPDKKNHEDEVKSKSICRQTDGKRKMRIMAAIVVLKAHGIKIDSTACSD